MAITESTIRLIFDGSAKGVTSAAAAARAALKGLDDDTNRVTKTSEKLDKVFTGLVKGLATLGAAGSAVQVIGGVAGAVAQLAPAALLVPGAALAAAAAVGTFKLATVGLGDALKAGLSGDMAKFTKATKDMAPAMQDAVKAIVSFKPQLDDLRKTVQTKFWDQFSVGLKNLGNNLLPVLQKSLPQLSQELGNIAKQAVNMLGKPAAINDIREVLDNTTDTLRGMRPALANVLSGFLGIAGVGSTYLPRLGKAIEDVTGKFKKWVDSAVESGQLKDLIDGAIAGFRDLGGIVQDVGSIVVSVFTGLGGAVSSPLAALHDFTGQLSDFLKTPEAQAGLQALGDALSAAAAAMRDVVLTALQQLAPLLVDLAPAVKVVAQAIGEFLVAGLKAVGPLLDTFAKWASDHPETVKTITLAILGLAVAFKTLKTALAIKSAVDGAIGLIKKLAPAAGVEGAVAGSAWGSKFIVGAKKILKGAAVAAILFGVAEAVDAVNQKAADGKPLQGFERNLHNIVGAGEQILSGDFPGIFADIGDEWDTLVQKFQTGESPIGAVWKRISESFQHDFLDFFAAAPGKIGDALSSLGTTIASTSSGAWDSLVTTAQTAVTSVVTFVTGLPGMIGAALSSLGASIAATATGAWDSLVTATQTAIDSVVAFATDLPFKLGFALGALVGIIASAAVTAWNGLVTATTTAVTSTVTFASGLPGQIASALSALGSTIVSIATSAWSSFTSAVVTGANAAVEFVRSVPGLISSALSALGGLIASVATSAWNTFRDAVVTGTNAVVAFVRGIPGQVASALSALGGAIASVATSAWNSFRDAAVAGAAAAVAFVRGIPGQIASALSGLGGILVGAGRALMQGFLDGLKAVAGSITTFVSGFVAGIRSYFPFSPAKKGAFSGRGWTLYAGQALMEGFAEGMVNRTGLIASAADAAMRTAQSSLSGGGLALSAPNPNAGVLQQLLSLQSSAAPIQVTVLLDGQPVRDIARTEVATSNRATRRTVGMGAGTTF